METLTEGPHNWQKIEPSRLTLEHVMTKFNSCSRMLTEMVHGGRIGDVWGRSSEMAPISCSSVGFLQRKLSDVRDYVTQISDWRKMWQTSFLLSKTVLRAIHHRIKCPRAPSREHSRSRFLIPCQHDRILCAVQPRTQPPLTISLCSTGKSKRILFCART